MDRQHKTRKPSGLATPPGSGASTPIEGVVERVVPGGHGLLRSEEGIVLVPGGLPGDRVSVRALEGRSGARVAQSYDVTAPSELRSHRGDCGLHPDCGGCDLLHLLPTGRPGVLRELALDALRRTGRVPEDELAAVGELQRPPAPEGRRRARVHVGAGGAVGFHRRRSDALVPTERCPALVPALDAALARLARSCPLPPGSSVRLAVDDRGRTSAALDRVPRRRAGELTAALVDGGVVDGALLVDKEGHPVAEAGDPVLLGEIAPDDEGGAYASCAGTFTQATRFGGRAITEAVLDGLAGRELGEGYALELFAGAGHLTFPLARLGLDVVAVEGAGRATHWLVENLDRSGLERVRCVEAAIDGETFGSGLLDQLEAFPDVLVADPPRTGIPRFERFLEVLAPRVIVLVSCDPATGARDLGVARRFGYRLEKLTLIDAFPRTSHLEWVAVLVDESGEAALDDGEEGA